MEHYLNQKLGISCEHSRLEAIEAAKLEDKNVMRVEKALARKKTVVTEFDAKQRAMKKKTRKNITSQRALNSHGNNYKMARENSSDDDKSDGQIRREREAQFAAERNARQNDDSSDASDISKTSSEYQREEAIAKLKAKQKKLEEDQKKQLVKQKTMVNRTRFVELSVIESEG